MFPKYQCPVCKKSYESWEDAMACINRHPTLASVDTPTERVEDHFNHVYVTMSNGDVFLYSYARKIGGEGWDE